MESGFWFVDIPRTGSSSLRHNLFQAFGFPHGKTAGAKLPNEIMFLPSHRPAATVLALVGRRNWDRLFTFSFVRDPYARFASLYQHYRFREKSWAGSFPHFVEELKQHRSSMPCKKRPLYAHRQIDYLMDPHGRLLVSFVGKYENRNEDIVRIMSRLKMTKWDDGIYTPSLQKPEEGFLGMYSTKLRHDVFEYFRADFEAFGYAH